MKGTFDQIYEDVKKSHDEAAKKGGLFTLLLGRPPSKSKIIRDLAGRVPENIFGKDYFQAMVIVLQAHWFVSLTLDLLISQFLMPEKEAPRRSELVFQILPHTPMHAKVALIIKYRLLDSKQVERLKLINGVRNSIAHFYQPSDKRMLYRCQKIVTEEGLERFWKDCEEVLAACLFATSTPPKGS